MNKPRYFYTTILRQHKLSGESGYSAIYTKCLDGELDIASIVSDYPEWNIIVLYSTQVSQKQFEKLTAGIKTEQEAPTDDR